MEKMRRTFAFVVFIALLLSVLFSISFVSHGASHDCVGEDCQISAVINKCAETLRDIVALGACTAIFGIYVLSLRIIADDSGESYIFTTPVRLEVKLTN
jgi:hypothetical protein